MPTGIMSHSSVTCGLDCASSSTCSDGRLRCHLGRPKTLESDRRRGVPPPPPHIELLKLAECGGRCICRVVSYLDSRGRVAAAGSCSYLRDAVGEYLASKRDYDALARFERERARQDDEARRILAEVERLRSLAAASAPIRSASMAGPPLLQMPSETRRGRGSTTKEAGGSPRRVDEFPPASGVMASSAVTKPPNDQVLQIKRLLSAEVDASMAMGWRGEDEESETSVAAGHVKVDEGTGKEDTKREEEEEGILFRNLSEGRKCERREERRVLAAEVLARQAELERIEREEHAERLRRLAAHQAKSDEEQGGLPLANARLEEKMRAVEEAGAEDKAASQLVLEESHRLDNKRIERYQNEEKQAERLADGDSAAVNTLETLERGRVGKARRTADEAEGLVVGPLGHEEIEAEESLKDASSRRTVAHMSGESELEDERLAAAVTAQLEPAEQTPHEDRDRNQAAPLNVSEKAEGGQLERERSGKTCKTEKVARRKNHESERAVRGKFGWPDVQKEDDACIADETEQENERPAAGDAGSIKPSTVKRQNILREMDDLNQTLLERPPALIKSRPDEPDCDQEAVPRQPFSQVVRPADQDESSTQADIRSTPVPCLEKRWGVGNIGQDARGPLPLTPSLDPLPPFHEEEGINAAKRKQDPELAQVDEDLDSVSTMDMRAQSDAFLARVTSSGMQTPMSFLQLGSYPEEKVHDSEHCDCEEGSDHKAAEPADELSVVPTVSHSSSFLPSTPEMPLLSTPSPKSLSGATRLEMGSSDHLGDGSKFHIFGRVRQLYAMNRPPSYGLRYSLKGENIDGEASGGEVSDFKSAPMLQQASPGGTVDEVAVCTSPVDEEGCATPAVSNGESCQPPQMPHMPKAPILSGPHGTLALPRCEPQAVGEETPFDELGLQPPASEGSPGSAFSPYKPPSHSLSRCVRVQLGTSEVAPPRMAAIRELVHSGINNVEDNGSARNDSCREPALGGNSPDILAQFSDAALFGETPRIVTDFMAEIVDSAKYTWHSLSFTGRRNGVDDAGPIKIGGKYYTHNEALQLWRKAKVKLEDQCHSVDKEGLDFEHETFFGKTNVSEDKCMEGRVPPKGYSGYDGDESVCEQNDMPGLSLQATKNPENRTEQGAAPIDDLIRKCTLITERNRSLDESTILAGNKCVDSDEEVGVEEGTGVEEEEDMAGEEVLEEEVACGETLDRNISVSSKSKINGESFDVIGNRYEMRRESRHLCHSIGHSSPAEIRSESHNDQHSSIAGMSSKFHNGGCTSHAEKYINGSSSQPKDNKKSRIGACSYEEDSHKAQNGPDASRNEHTFDGRYSSCSDNIDQSHYCDNGEMSSNEMEGDTALTDNESKSDTGSEGLADMVDRMLSPVFGGGSDSVATSDASNGHSESYTTGGESRASGSVSYCTTGSISVAKSDDIELKKDIQPKQSSSKKKDAASSPTRSHRLNAALVPFRSTHANAHNETESIAGRDSLPSHMGSAYGVEVTSLRGTDCNFVQGKKSERIKIHRSGKSVKSIKGKSCEQSVLGSQYGTEVVFKPNSKKAATARKPRTLANHNMGVKSVKQNCNATVKFAAAPKQSAVKLAKQSSNASPKGDPVPKPNIGRNKGVSLRQQQQRAAALSLPRIVPPKGTKAKMSKSLPLKLKLGIKSRTRG